MTFDPVLPPVVLAVVGAVLLVLRLLSLRPAVIAGAAAFLRWAAMTLAIALLVLAAARPGTGEVTPAPVTSDARGGTNVYLVVDRTAETAGDTPEIRADIDAVIDAHPGARFSLITFAARPAVEWPLSSDAWSLRPVVAALRPDPADTADTVNAAAAATVLRYALISAGQQYPGADNLVYYFGSGAPESQSPQGEFDRSGVDGGAVFGYGAVDEQRLSAIAGQLGVPLVARRAGEAPPTGPAADTATTTAVETEHREEYYWLPALVAAALLLTELGWSVRDLRRARSSVREASR